MRRSFTPYHSTLRPLGPFHHQGGFTLVELAIILVIISLIVGGIIAAQSVIRSTQIVTVATEIDDYRVAITLFKDRYKSKPGDMSDAFDYFGNDCGSNDTSSTGCNGNDDGIIGESDGERLKAWKHLQLAGTVTGNYSGTEASGSIYGAISTNIPGSTIDNAGYMFNDDIPAAQNSFLPEVDHLLLGSDNDGSGDFEGPAIDPVFAQAVDLKVDDGKAYSGLTVSTNGDGSTGCITTPNSANGDYDLSTELVNCTLRFYINDITD